LREATVPFRSFAARHLIPTVHLSVVDGQEVCAPAVPHGGNDIWRPVEVTRRAIRDLSPRGGVTVSTVVLDAHLPKNLVERVIFVVEDDDMLDRVCRPMSGWRDARED
jgi:hypothetical protein